MSVTCPNCQNSVPSDAAFCDNCGANLHGPTELPCAVCGTRAHAGDVKCRACGADLPAASVPAEVQIVWPGAESLPAQAAERTCPNCGNQVRGDARFCDHCGTALSAGTVQPSVTRQDVGLTPPGGTAAPKTVLEAREADVGRTIVEFSRPGAPTGYLDAESRFVAGSLVLTASGIRLEFPPKRSEILVGREDPRGNVFPEIDLAQHGGETGGVSRLHARLSIHRGDLVVEDLNSKNGTFVNRERVPPGTQRVVRPGDEVRFGRVIARYERG